MSAVRVTPGVPFRWHDERRRFLRNRPVSESGKTARFGRTVNTAVPSDPAGHAKDTSSRSERSTARMAALRGLKTRTGMVTDERTRVLLKYDERWLCQPVNSSLGDEGRALESRRRRGLGLQERGNEENETEEGDLEPVGKVA
ncbi:hypothetical protein VTN49DRAFT_4148 [Thermomyces lanuginosus]|uniref:uncharacterized protein n=1 Tax=Thermomyces lanuginosus TaxID=5541 RepID=UPI003743F96C